MTTLSYEKQSKGALLQPCGPKYLGPGGRVSSKATSQLCSYYKNLFSICLSQVEWVIRENWTRDDDDVPADFFNVVDDVVI